VIRLLDQPEMRSQIGARARQLVEKEYDWDPISSRLDQMLRNVVSK
jgi:glycosyltransferase involved in cell wall biosynthesis